MYTSIIILIGIIILLMGYIKFHIDLQYFPDERKWYEKIRFILPLLLLPIFSLIYVYWDQYPNRLIAKDSKIEAIKTQSNNTIVWPYEIPTVHSVAPNADEDSKTKLQEIGEKYGTYGDTYGSLNTLFTGFAFAGLIISIFIQLLELRQTRKELSGQKSEFAAQTKILAKQAQISSEQQKILNEQFKESQKLNFINQFYSLLDQRNNILKNITLYENNIEYKGNRVISLYVNKFREIINNYDVELHDGRYLYNQFKHFSKDTFGQLDYQIISYFRYYRVMFYTINKSNAISDNEKKYYNSIIKNFISVDEQTILMWIGTFDKNITKICNTHALLGGIYNKKLEVIGCRFFNKSAFGNDVKWLSAYNKPSPQEKI